ncbi:GntR family transcriptional regulator [Kitasatospora sp. NPDC101801]|uniref:GntR family transcriptional regulator n=1 Tax=Kitasatospora sp. NPDC101801 TaxID=3364103 RepID=UPI0038146311
MTVSVDDERPKYVQVADTLRVEIETRALQPGQKLPSLRELAERFGIAEMTVQSALRVLREEGVIISTAGRGSFVRSLEEPEPTESELSVHEQIDHLSAELRRLAERVAKLEQQAPRSASDSNDG